MINSTNNMSGASEGKTSGAEHIEKEELSQFPLVKKNFVLMGISAAVIIIGFLLMLGGGSTTDGFNPDIFSTRRIVVGPTLAFLGFIALGISIIYNPEKKNR